LRGNYFDKAVLDEYGLHPPKTFSEVIGPTLVDRGGGALFLGTPNGKNQFYDIAELAKAESEGECRVVLPGIQGVTDGPLAGDYLTAAARVMTATNTPRSSSAALRRP
jgi:phage terminase large subunit